MMGAMMAATPRTRAMLVMLEPMTLPMANPGLPSIEARVETIISGMDVPNPKTTTPMMRGETLKCREVLAAPSIKTSELQTRRVNPIIRPIVGNKSVSNILKIL